MESENILGNKVIGNNNSFLVLEKSCSVKRESCYVKGTLSVRKKVERKKNVFTLTLHDFLRQKEIKSGFEE